MSWICLGETQKSHLPPVCSHKIAINLSSDPKIALWMITGLAKPFLRFPILLYPNIILFLTLLDRRKILLSFYLRFNLFKFLFFFFFLYFFLCFYLLFFLSFDLFLFFFWFSFFFTSLNLFRSQLNFLFFVFLYFLSLLMHLFI